MWRSAQSSNLYSLSQPVGGLLGLGVCFHAESDEPRLTIQTVRLGDLNRIWPSVKKSWPKSRSSIHGAGVGIDPKHCLTPALGEGLERYCTGMYTEKQVIWATAHELGGEALDLDAIPRCSKAEMAHPRCFLVAPDKTAPMRWVRGLSLVDGRVLYLPITMVFLYTGVASRGERIWIQITTGCAAHTSFERALLAGMLEVIERDAISITWLQQLRLPRIEVDLVPPPLAAYWDRYQRSSKGLEYVFFDATTDVGVPTVYGLQISHANRRLTTLVSCCTAMNPVDAVAKVIRDMAACRVAFRGQRSTEVSGNDFSGLFDGATFMARFEHACAFEFLLQSGNKRLLSKISAL